ncbi:MAG: YbgC/FadM family acyl-CoA thioesterase [Spirochaetales bacterium]|jgi:acyl-CoA thioester hydrolase|nr:YbgC/FadM family acyl-CoA thioesterase [Spirochaetales bacterium]
MKTFIFKQRVYFSDTDAGGIVYHASYLNFAEHARTESLREISSVSQGEMLAKFNYGFVVKSIFIDYKKPAFIDDLLTVKTSVKEFKKFSAVFEQLIYREEELLTSLEVKVACIDLATKRPILIPEEVLKGFNLQ